MKDSIGQNVKIGDKVFILQSKETAKIREFGKGKFVKKGPVLENSLWRADRPYEGQFIKIFEQNKRVKREI